MRVSGFRVFMALGLPVFCSTVFDQKVLNRVLSGVENSRRGLRGLRNIQKGYGVSKEFGSGSVRLRVSV